MKSVDTRDLNSHAFLQARDFKSRLAHQYGYVAQVVEHKTENLGVRGANPCVATIEIIIWIRNSKSVSNSVSIRLELGFV